MSRRALIIGGIAALVVLATGFGLYARTTAAAAPGTIDVAGDVRAEEYVVRAPVVTNPVPDYTVGFPVTGTPAAKKRPASAPASASRLPVVSGFMTEVLVAEGAQVTTGQVLARLDTTMLDLGVRGADAAAAKARSDVHVLDNNISKLVDARATLIKARTKLIKARASLATTITLLVRQRASLEASITAIKALIARPGGPPPHVPPYPVILAGLQAGLGQLSAGLAGARTGLAAMNAGLAKMATGFSQISSGLRQLRDARDLVRINVTAQEVAVRLAKARRVAATITSPASGIVTFARAAGTAVIVGAPIVRIRPDSRTRVDTYLTTDQLLQVRVGTPATVTFDSNTRSALSGRVAVIGSVAVVPPTGFPTSIVHMTRAVRVTIELDAGLTAPPGTPVDIEIRTGSVR